VLEANAQLFDLSSPLGALHFSTFLAMLATEHARKLGERLDGVKDRFYKMCGDSDEHLAWSKVQQS
ncbi:hypothetical protein GLOTRDRAFT_21311, partial [Gloeophyllum trabeum ATCC 11539]